MEPWRLGVSSACCYLPFIGLGYGTDIDITNIRRSGESILAGDYRYSRPPGAFPHEAVTGVLDRVGGPGARQPRLGRWPRSSPWSPSAAWSNGATGPGPAASPSSWPPPNRGSGSPPPRSATTSTPSPSSCSASTPPSATGGSSPALAFGLAVGFRAAIVAPGRGLPAGRGHWALGRRRRRARRRARTDARAVDATLCARASSGPWSRRACFIPPWLSVGRTDPVPPEPAAGRRLRRDGRPVGREERGLLRAHHHGRSSPCGPPSCWRRWPGSATWSWCASRSSPPSAPSCCTSGSRGSRSTCCPWRLPRHPAGRRPPYVQPARGRRRGQPAAARRRVGEHRRARRRRRRHHGRFAPGITPGVVVNDIDCRLDPPFEGTWPALDGIDADLAAVRVFECQARSWRAGEGPG